MLKRLQALIAQTQSGDRPLTIPTSSMTQQDIPIDTASNRSRFRCSRNGSVKRVKALTYSLVVLVSTAILGFTGTGLLLAGKTTEGSVAARGACCQASVVCR